MAPYGATADPRLERGDVVIGEFAGRWHFDSIVITDGLDELAFVGFSWNEDGSIFAAAHHRVLTVHLQAARARFGVAGVAILCEQRTDLRFEEFADRIQIPRRPGAQARESGSRCRHKGSRGRVTHHNYGTWHIDCQQFCRQIFCYSEASADATHLCRYSVSLSYLHSPNKV